MKNQAKFLFDAFRELSSAQQDIFEMMLSISANRSADVVDIAQAKRRLARATAALNMLCEGVPTVTELVRPVPKA